MPVLLQNFIVFLAVGVAFFFLVRQGWRTLAGRRSRLGSCCAKGCAANEPTKPSSGERIVFLPAEMLGRKK
jgi:hypothetical protein